MLPSQERVAGTAGEINLLDVAEESRTQQVCREAVEINGSNIFHVPKQHLDDDMRRIAFANDKWRVIDFSLSGLTDGQVQELVYATQSRWYSDRSPFGGDPGTGYVSFKTDEDWTRAALIAPCRMIFHEMPDHLKSYEVCLKNAYDIQIPQIPAQHRDAEMYQAATRFAGSRIADVPEEFRTKEFFMEALKTDHGAIDYVPEELVHDPDICLAAATCLMNDPCGDEDRYHPLESEHPRLVDPSVWAIAIKQDYSLIDWVPQEVWDNDKRPEFTASREVMMEAVKTGRMNLSFVPLDVIEDAVSALAAEGNTSTTPELPEAISFGDPISIETPSKPTSPIRPSKETLSVPKVGITPPSGRKKSASSLRR